MAGGPRDPVSLVTVLDRHREDAVRVAQALLELDDHPGHRLLADGSPTGATGRRWAEAGPAMQQLWHDFDRYRDVLARAQRIRERRGRPGARECAELRQLLVLPTIEVARHRIGLEQRELTGHTERVETLTLDALVARMHEAYRTVSQLVARCDELSSAALAALVAPTERLGRIRGELAAPEGEPDATVVDDCARELSALRARAIADPLATVDGAVDVAAAELEARLVEVETRVGRTRALREGWSRVRTEIGAAVDGLADRRAAVLAERDQVARRIAGALTPMPADAEPALRAALRRLDAAGWTARESGVEAVRRGVAAAVADLDRARTSAAGLLERRAELRGRFEAFRARAVRLGLAEDPEILALGGRVETTLWSAPADLGAATRDLAAYRRRLTEARPPGAHR